MRSISIVALTALLTTGALAVPMAGHHHKAPAHGHWHRRRAGGIVWVTETEIETVVVIKTVYDDGSSPSEPTDAATTTVKATAPATTSSTPVAAPSSPSETGGSPPPAYTPPTTSSQAPAPTTSSTSVYVAPPPPSSTTQAPAPTTYSPEPAHAPTTYSPEPAPQPSYSAPAPAPSQPSGGSSGGATFTGDATYWEPALGACGWTNNSGEDVVAISKTVFDEKTPNGNPNNNPLCGKYVAIKGKDGSTIRAKIVDRCVGCASGDLDMTKTLFDKVTGNGDGRVGGMQWSWA